MKHPDNNQAEGKIGSRPERAPFAKKFADLHQKYVAPFAIISVAPVVIHLPLFPDQLESIKRSYEILFNYLKDGKVYIVCNWGGFVEESEDVGAVKKLQEYYLRSHKNFQFIHLCNTPDQLDIFIAAGLEGIFCNHNCFVDERVFSPSKKITRKYDAVYDARLSIWKRHYLAAKIESLGLIYYFLPSEDDEYSNRVLKDFSHAYDFNTSNSGKYERLSIGKINECLNQCRVGLCLSEEEGAMYASVQYLLCGLPVVTTPSKGGREVFFDEEYVLTVKPEPSVVKGGVEEMIRRDLSPEYIRRKTLEKMLSHRERFIELIQSIYDLENCDRKFRDEWDQIFFNRMLKNQNQLEAINKLEKPTH